MTPTFRRRSPLALAVLAALTLGTWRWHTTRQTTGSVPAVPPSARAVELARLPLASQGPLSSPGTSSTSGPAEAVASVPGSGWVRVAPLPPGAPVPHPDADFPHRMRNTPDSLDQLSRSDRALLLRNALVDTASGEPVPVPEAWHGRGEAGSYIVQAPGPIDEAFRGRLAAAGVEILAYIPQNAYLVRGSASAAAALAGQGDGTRVLPNEPWFKLEPGLARRELDQQPQPSRLILTVPKPESDLPSVQALGATVVGRQRGPFGELVTVDTLPGTLPQLAQLAGVTLIEEAPARALLNDRSGYLLGSSTNTDNTVSYLGLTGTNILVNVNDSGIDAAHPDLLGRVGSADTNALTDVEGHGTHVAGTIAGSGVQSSTVTKAQGSATNANFRGHAPGARLFVLPVDLATGPLISDQYLQETYARTNLVQANRAAPISNNSWSYRTFEYNSASASYDAAVRDALPTLTGDQPILYVFAAGNSGFGGANGLGGAPDTVLAPANGKNVLTVGALESARRLTNLVVFDTNGIIVRSGSRIIPGRGYVETNETYTTNAIFAAETDTDYEVASFSSRGNVGIGLEGLAGRFKPDVVAPGTYVLSTRSRDWALTNDLPADSDLYPITEELNDEVGPWYRYQSGTSMSAPAVSGLLAQMQEFLEVRNGNRIGPDGYKALVINSARVTSPTYNPNPKDFFNYAGWGRPDLRRALNSGFAAGRLLNGIAGPAPGGTNTQLLGVTVAGRTAPGLTSGESRTYRIRFTRPQATNQPIRLTLVWTDPPGNPAAAYKLVNDLDLIVTNVSEGTVFYGNNIDAESGYSQIFPASGQTNAPVDPADPFTGSPLPTPEADFINNVERIILPGISGTELLVTVRARRVNVNALASHPNQVVQDGVLVFQTDAGETLGVVATVEDVATGNQAVQFQREAPLPVTNGVPLFNQRVAANSPLIGGTNGSTNQWRFYTFTNVAGGVSFDGSLTNGSNVAFVTFFPPNASRPRNEDGDLDLYVSFDPGLTNLVPAAVNAAFRSTGRGGSEYVVFTNAPLTNEVYYIGVKSEDQQAAEYTFLAVSSTQAFNTPNQDGTISFLGIPIQQPIPDGSPDQPGVGLFFALGLDPRGIRQVFVQQVISHTSFPDLVGSLYHNNQAVVLHNHRPIYDVDVGEMFGGTNVLAAYDDLDTGLYPGSRPSDGPGRLVEFMGRPAGGVWILQTVDSALGNQGRVQAFDLRVLPNDFGTAFVGRTVPAGGCVYEVVNVPPDASRLTVAITNINPAYPLEVHIRREELPDFVNPANNDRNATITPPGGTVSIGVRDVPPLTAGRYFIAVCNPHAVPINYDIARFFDLDLGTNFNRTLTSEPSQNIALPDMARATSTIVVDDNRPVSAVEVGLRISHPRQSDLAIHLVNPQGQRALITENRGRLDNQGYGGVEIITNLQHVAMSYDPSTRLASVFLDGRPVAVSNLAGVILPSTNALHFGTDPQRNFSSNKVNVVVDDFGFWGRPLALNEIGRIYRDGTLRLGKDRRLSASGLQALWPFDGNGADLVGTNFVALLGAWQVTGGQIGGAISFPGITAQGRTPPINLTGRTGFTLEGWVGAPGGLENVVVASFSPVVGQTGPALLVGFPPPLGNGPGSVSAVFRSTNGTPLVVASAPRLVQPIRLATNVNYAVFSDRTNFTAGPVKFASPPFRGVASAPTVLVDSSFETVRPAVYLSGSRVEDWQVVSNRVEVSAVGPLAYAGTQVLALRDATVEREFPVVPGGQYRLSLNTRRDPAATNAPAVDLYFDGALETSVPTFTVWDGYAYQFVAVANTLRVRLQPTTLSAGTNGTPATVWLDSVRLEEFGRQQTYQPEETTRPLLGRPGAGEWRLEVTDARGVQVGRIDSWQLRLTFAPTNPPVVRLTNMVPAFGEVPGAQFKYFLVEVPLEARAATNYLFTPDGPLDLLYNDTGLPDGTQLGDVVAPQIPWVINTNVPPVLPRGQRYYLGVRNPDPAQTRRFEIRVDFDLAIIPLTNNVPYARTNIVAGLLDYYSFDVSRDATAVEFALTNLTGDVNLFVSRAPNLPRPLRFDYAGTNTGTLPELVRVDLASEPVPLDAGRWYLAVAGVSTNPVNYTVIAREVPGQFLRINDGVTNRVTNSVVGGFDYFVIDVPADAELATVRVTPVAGDADLFVKKGVPLPDEFRYDYASSNPDLTEEVVAIDPFSDPVPLRPGRWFAGVQAVGPAPVIYDISVNFVRPAIEDLVNGVAVVRTNFGAGYKHFRLTVPPGALSTRFEVYNILNEADLLVARDVLPTNAPLVFSNILPGTNAEVITLTNTQASLPGDWYLSVVTSNTAPNVYTIRASFLTNAVVPPGTNVTIRIFPPVAPSTNGFIEWDSVVGRRYQVEYTDAFNAAATTWNAFGSPVTAVSTVTRVEVPFPEPFRLYRVIDLGGGGVTPPPATNVVATLVLLPDGTNALLSWVSVPTRQYQVQYTTNLFVASPVWSNFGSAITAVSNVTSVTVPLPATETRFYRVIDLGGGGVTPPPATNVVSMLTLLPDGTNALLSWNSVPARQYQVQFTDDPFVAVPAWTAFGTPVTAVSNVTSVSVPLPGSTRFYRVIDVTGGVTPPPPAQPVQVLFIPPVPPSLDATLEWNSVVGRGYQIQFASGFTAATTTWQDFGVVITATATVTRASVPAPDGAFRLYRVVDVGGGTVNPPVVPPGQPISAGFALSANGTNGVLTFNSVSNRQYQVQFTADFAGTNSSWASFGGVITATGPVTQVTLPLPGDGFRLYRVVDVTGSGGTVTPPPVIVPEPVAQLLWPAAPGQPWVVQVNSVAGARYQLQSSANLSAWSDLGPVVTASGTTTRIEVPTLAGETAFLRVRVVP